MKSKNLLSMILAMLASATVLSGCQNIEPDTSSLTGTTSSLAESEDTTFEELISRAEVVDVSFEEAIAESNSVVCAKCLSYEEFDEYTDYYFSLVDTYKGDVDDTFYVRWIDYDSILDTVPFSVSQNYILPLKYVNSAYFDYPVYNVYAHMTMLCSGNNIVSISVGGTIMETGTTELKADSFADYVATIADTSEKMFEDCITSDVLNDIISRSDYIVKAKITGEPNRTGSDRGIYPCEITQRFKGDISDIFESVFMYDSVEIGKEYYFFLTKPDETSRFYIVSSKNSIYDASNQNVINALENSGLM